MNKETITKLLTVAAFTVSAASGFAQTNLGSSCGCPPVSSRPSVLLSTLAVNGGGTDGSLTATTTILDCSTNWILDKKIFVDAGKSLVINEGTVIKGRARSTSDSATALIVSRDAKIFANGTESCPIVFTAEADPMDGSYSIRNTGKWGGIVIAGKATNNLTLAANGPYVPLSGNGKLCVANGLGSFEGFASSDTRFQFGADLTGGQSFDDNDNSGILRYVSVRHSGTVLQVGAELNGISCGSVGRGTTLEHIEIISCGDDNMEFWGGTVNVKHASFLFGNDDGFDYDDGYSGKVQFVFGMKSATNDSTLTAHDGDNGFECDADDQKSSLLPRSHPLVYNCTFIGTGKPTLTSDNSGATGIMAKELTEGEFYNSIFANYRYGFDVVKTLTGSRTEEAWNNWSNGATSSNPNSLKVKCNAFINCTKDIAIDKNSAVPVSAADSAQFFGTDKNVHLASAPGFNYTWSMNGGTNAVATPASVTPNPGITIAGCPTAPVDGFFTPANYNGAFDPSAPSWLSNWSYAQVLQVIGGVAPCPTDLNHDGVTNNADFLILLSQFNVSCQ